MAATFLWSESNTVSQTVHNSIANLNFGSNDSYEIVTATYPITRGNASFEKYIRAKFTGIGTSISNMLFWMSVGVLVTGEVITCAYNATFATPSQTPNADSAIPVTSGGSSAIQDSGGNTTMTVDGYTKYLRLQLQTSGSTPSGAVNTKTFTMQYDEI